MRNVHIENMRYSDVCLWVETQSQHIASGGVVVERSDVADYLRCGLLTIKSQQTSLEGILRELCSQTGLSLSIKGNRAFLRIDTELLKGMLQKSDSLKWALAANVYVHGRRLDDVDRLLALNLLTANETFIEGDQSPRHAAPIYFVDSSRMLDLWACSGGWVSGPMRQKAAMDFKGFEYRASLSAVDTLFLYLRDKYCKEDGFAADVIKHLDDPR